MNPFEIEKFDKTKSLYIQASAGTGKTYTINLIVKKLVSEGCPIQKLLIVTYTEKAAGELKDRIRKTLETCLKKAKNSAEIEKFRRALNDLRLADIGTIHSFCQKVLREYAYESNQPFALEIVPEDACEEIVDRFLRDEASHDEVFQTYLRSARNIEDIRNPLIELLKKYNPVSTQFQAMDRMLMGEDFSNNEKEYLQWLLIEPKDLPQMPRFQKVMETLKANQEEFISGSKKICDFIQSINSKITNNEKGLYDGHSFQKRFIPANLEENLYQDIVDVMENMKPFFEDKKGNRFKRLKDFFVEKYLQKLYQKWQDYKKENKLQTFNDMILNVYDQCEKENSELVKTLQKTYQYAIIDEFQDTNLLQWGIFSKVFLNVPEHAIWVVGDPKQSIYAFQGANLNVYNAAVNQIHEGASLSNNYRSTKAMIDACNLLFQVEKSSEAVFHFTFEKSNYPKKPKATTKNATWNGRELKPLMISPERTKARDFARFAVEKIIRFCEMNDGKTALQISGENGGMRNVKFSDFAILARTRSEQVYFEYELQNAGLPYLRYKDNNLFSGHENTIWFTLLRALDAPDFAGKNRAVLRSALVTEFFGKGVNELADDILDNPQTPEMQIILELKQIAKTHRWSDLFEKIYDKTKIESALNSLEKMQKLARVHQIGDYALQYLYAHNCTLGEVSAHLEALSVNAEDSENEGGLVAKGTDLDAIQMMTIHASKGLEFPIVISAAGFKGYREKNSAYIYSDENSEMRYLSLDKDAAEKQKKEIKSEWERLFYVNFTRASHLLILPRYDEFYSKQKVKEGLEFLNDAMEGFVKDNQQFFDILQEENDLKSLNARKEAVAKILENLNRVHSEDEKTADILYKEMQEMQLFEKKPHTCSYSSIAHGSVENEESKDSNPSNKPANADEEGHEISSNDDVQENKNAADSYPRGSLLGNALHKIFEEIHFEEIGKESLEEALKNSKWKNLVIAAFEEQSLDILNHPDWNSKTVEMVWNTISAKLPKLKAEKEFSLSEILFENRRSEMEFRMNLEECQELKNFIKGFIDLIFVKDGRFFVLDWKSDTMEKYDAQSLEEQMKLRHYDIQRVIYSYILIQWLQSFGDYKNKTEEEIFENIFGGIYYVFFRGCRAGENSGIYAKDFSSYAELKSAYDKIMENYKAAKQGK
ncbi:MAG: UvrD-helicase domain-containing protein [Hallerella porci]|uniref:UvrD-helicase domain-containing protein n=1 Tax=Hallerella porci TaxID=1945871 RepID=UPI002A7FD906|nr:UvrD-helicase domain-containing protein [Hallerella porci]MDY3922162.1 UvrD-helicase domain-containing protein [Hallerella porci]